MVSSGFGAWQISKPLVIRFCSSVCLSHLPFPQSRLHHLRVQKLEEKTTPSHIQSGWEELVPSFPVYLSRQTYVCFYVPVTVHDQKKPDVCCYPTYPRAERISSQSLCCTSLGLTSFQYFVASSLLVLQFPL